jgi:hypothetical protein
MAMILPNTRQPPPVSKVAERPAASCAQLYGKPQTRSNAADDANASDGERGKLVVQVARVTLFAGFELDN